MQLPRRVGRYRVTGLLGRGGMGVVLRGRDDALDRDVAIKLMTGAIDATATGRFHREARMSARLQHPNIVTIFELGEHEEQSFIAMELLAGTDLRTAISRGLQRTPAVAGPILLQVLAGLGHAHEHGVVHRDVKASNVFLPRGRPAKILDFGVARTSSSASITTGLVGTPDCMAPEQIEGGQADARSDIYTAGLLLYELLCGEKAFSSESLAGLLYKIVHEGPDLSRLPVGPGIGPLVPILARAVARDPAERYPDTASMAADIQRAGGGIDPTTVVAAPGPDATAEPVGASGQWEPLDATPAPQPAARAARPAPAPRQPEPPQTPAPAPAQRTQPAAAATGLPLRWLALAAVLALALSSGLAWLVWGELRRRASGPTDVARVTASTPASAQRAPSAKTGAPSRGGTARTAAPPVSRPPTPIPARPSPAPTPAASPRPARPPAAGSLDGLLDRANRHLESRRYASALQDARSALRVDPANAEAKAILEEAEMALTVEEHLRRGKQALRAGDKATAASEARAGLALAPQDSRLKSLLRDAGR
ncbi:MAG: protein kinase [Vicinamibacteria bacterium]